MNSINTNGGLSAFIISSDPQFPRRWVDGKEEYKTDAASKAAALETLQANYSDMQAYRDANKDKLIPVLVNGDITEYGDKKNGPGDSFLTVMRDDVFPILGDKDNVLIGLGNHGYDNNINDTADNGAAGGMLEWFPKAKPKTWLPEDQNEGDKESDDSDNNFDWRHNFYDGWTGDIWYPFSSYSYAVEKKDPSVTGTTYRFIQLNNYPEYARHFETGSFVGDEHIYNVTPSTAWLAQQLKRAGEKNQIVIVSMHQNRMSGAIRTLLESANVTLVCVGHTHGISSRIGGTANLPIVNSGASFKGTYLIAEAEGDSLNIFAVSDNDHGSKKSIGSVPLKVANSNVPQDDVGRYVVFERDDDGYIDGIAAYVSLAKSDVYYLNKDSYFNDLVESCTINRADEGTEITVYDHPGDKDMDGGDFGHYDDDYAVITIKKALTQPIKITTFEEDYEDEFISLKAHYVNGLDHKISRVSVKLKSAEVDSLPLREAKLSRDESKHQLVQKVLQGDLQLIEVAAILDIGLITMRRMVDKARRERKTG
ncbi:metallophosphoesterase [Pseudomonas sp. RC3H12]|uniref:metallophosphoesterase n=1 Tax=Pseudomonas sp. RC3H12 TaxID=2834406 RepID=UPI001BDE62B4|nr:metallophosphoesterase [Pseudomonas sp. RC3H12]QWA27713.1 metallophosphoesterase [Pseudomonas sp. RC3H12]